MAMFCRRECHFDQPSTKEDWIFVLNDFTNYQTGGQYHYLDSNQVVLRAKTMTKHQMLEAWATGQDRIQFVTREQFTSRLVYYEQLHSGDNNTVYKLHKGHFSWHQPSQDPIRIGYNTSLFTWSSPTDLLRTIDRSIDRSVDEVADRIVATSLALSKTALRQHINCWLNDHIHMIVQKQSNKQSTRPNHVTDGQTKHSNSQFN
jgi:hypothetical protein